MLLLLLLLLFVTIEVQREVAAFHVDEEVDGKKEQGVAVAVDVRFVVVLLLLLLQLLLPVSIEVQKEVVALCVDEEVEEKRMWARLQL